MSKGKALSSKPRGRLHKRITPWGVYRSAIRHIDQYGLPISPEGLFASFEDKIRIHKAFGLYEKQSGMKRSGVCIGRRRVFAQWFFNRYGGGRRALEVLREVSELMFVSERTIEEDLKKGLEEEKSEATAIGAQKSCDKA